MTTLLVCSGGGHLRQMWTLWPRFELNDDPLWITFDTGLSRSLLEDQHRIFAPVAQPRDLGGTFGGSKLAERVFREHHIARVISTGATPAVSFFPSARIRGIACHYIESAARSDGPSVSGRIVRQLPGVNMYTQYPGWAGGRWHYVGSVFDGYRVGSATASTPAEPQRVVVTVGTQETYSFRRLFERLVKILPSSTDVLWQTGATDVSGLGIVSRDTVPAAELEAAIAKADVVIAHAGTGSALTAFDAGKCPVLVPRLAKYGEHIDDHQQQIAAELHRRGLAVNSAVEELTETVLLDAMSRSVELVADPPRFPLYERSRG